MSEKQSTVEKFLSMLPWLIPVATVIVLAYLFYRIAYFE
jgi:hypothetical protein